jgi:hypothetical protein
VNRASGPAGPAGPPSAPYRVGILGLGGISRAHLRGYRAPENGQRVEIVAGADVSAPARERFAQDAGVERTYADYHELLERERPDVVSICTWPPLHAEMVTAACAAGVRGIVCEKPMAIDLASCDRMIAAAAQAGTVLVIGHQRYLKSPALAELSKDVLFKQFVDGVRRAEFPQVGFYAPGGYDSAPIQEAIEGKRSVKDALEAVNRDANQRNDEWKARNNKK